MAELKPDVAPQGSFWLIPSLVLVFSIPLVCFSQQPQQPARVQPLSVAARESLARPLLIDAEAATRDFDASTRALLLYRTAGAWLPLDKPRAIRLYRDAFAAARESAVTIRKDLEDAILNDLLSLSAADVFELLPNAERASQQRIYGGLITFSLFQGDYAAAYLAFDAATAVGLLPPHSAQHLLASIPVAQSGTRVRVFTAAVRYYDTQTGSQRYQWTTAELVARFYAQLPGTLVLEAIDSILAKADTRPSGRTMTFGGHEVTLRSEFDFQLFAVACALQQLDSDRAARLLGQHPDVAAALRKYPQGLASLDKGTYGPDADSIIPNQRKPYGLELFNTVEDAQNLSPMDMGLEFTIPRNLFIIGVTGSLVFFPELNSPESAVIDGPGGTCPSDLTHRLDLARAVPIMRKVPTFCSGALGAERCRYEETFPRASVLQVIAERCTYYGGPARLVLEEQLKVLEQVPEQNRIGYLATVADLYLRLGDRQAASRVVERGFAAARVLYDRDLAVPRFKDYPKGVWQSAEAYRRMVTLGVNASLDVTNEAIRAIPDAGLRKLEEVMLARALLGVPVRRAMTVSDGGFCILEPEVSYDQIAR